MADEPAKIILGDTAISAVERGARRRWFGRGRDRQPMPFTHCENCGAELIGPHCAQCGQAAIDYRRSFRHVIVDVLDSFLNWDSKFFATIGLLIVKPWRLTNEFLAGRRVRYLHPLRRSEEHTSELQSLTNLVCRLLLEKKKSTGTSAIRT